MGGSAGKAAEALCIQGFELHKRGQLSEAAEHYQRVLDIAPDHFEALYLFGLISVDRGQPERGVLLLGRAIELKPDLAAPHAVLGKALHVLGRPAEAIISYDKAIALQPNFADVYNNRGMSLQALGHNEEALASFQHAVTLNPHFAAAQNNLGSILRRLKRPLDALSSYDRAIKLNPRDALAHCNRGFILRELDLPDDAILSFDRAISLNPNLAEAYNDRGLALHALGRNEEALIDYRRAIALRPNFTDALVNRSLHYLLLGQFEAGWADYELRHIKRATTDTNRLWLGKGDLDGQTLFVPCEQGLGDTIQFCRYVNLLLARNISVILSAPLVLVELMRQSNTKWIIIGDHEAPPVFDYYCPLMSLPFACGTTLESIPSAHQYLFADDRRRSSFERLLGPKINPRIGVAWSGNAMHTNDRNRSIAFQQISPILTQDVDWICLQKEVRPDDAAGMREHGGVRFLGDRLADFNDTAALLDLMDLVITVDTSIAHLAGAMGKPVWILLPFAPDWRWMLDRGDSPWYSSARLFRQSTRGNWASVIEVVKAELQSSLLV
ncbi:MAG: glycosyltransferase family protein [Caulobacteraceae bacterium]|nr:glycosyltransferase family protein [Caulobacteraceae bacterium]